MKLSDNAMCAILLCSYVGIKSGDEIKPLSLGEWNQFLDKFIEIEKEPSLIMNNENYGLLNRIGYNEISIDRIKKLVSRGGAVAFELDDLSRKGIDVVTLFDKDYPVLLKKKLKRKTPPILFYAGDINLSKKIGIAVVGSRNVDESGVEFTKKLVEKAAKENLIVYSGGAKGVDTISEKTAIISGSAVVSFIADSLLSKIKKKEVIQYIQQGKLLLFSDVKPDAGFTAARAMNRNKLIYAASYGTFVVSSDYNKGGTWSGAVENIKNHWTKEFIWNNLDYPGNLKLIEKGGIAYSLSNEKIYDLITKKEIDYDQMDLFSVLSKPLVCEAEVKYQSTDNEIKDKPDRDLYNVICNHVMEQLVDGLTIDEAVKVFNVAKGQMTVWLKRLCKDNKVKYESGVYRCTTKQEPEIRPNSYAE